MPTEKPVLSTVSQQAGPPRKSERVGKPGKKRSAGPQACPAARPVPPTLRAHQVLTPSPRQLRASFGAAQQTVGGVAARVPAVRAPRPDRGPAAARRPGLAAPPRPAPPHGLPCAPPAPAVISKALGSQETLDFCEQSPHSCSPALADKVSPSEAEKTSIRH